MDEFSFIRTLLSPLAQNEAGALGLTDDAAILSVPGGQELVVTKDAMVAGVHFTGTEPADLIARKLLRVNLSDLSAMGAAPWGYFLALMLPESTDAAWLTAFARGLAADQQAYGITLLGGDTTRTGGPLSLSLTALGLVPQGAALKRSTAQVNDAIYVSGTIGDAALGLQVAHGEKEIASQVCGLTGATQDYLLRRYQLPEPRLQLGQKLRGIAHSCMDVSDGLMQDMGHICTASGVGARITLPLIPLSEAAWLAISNDPQPYETLLAGGDDYELLFTAPADKEHQLLSVAKACGVGVTRIGEVTEGTKAVLLDAQGNEIALTRKGYRHF